MRISLYDFGRIVVDGESHTRDVIIHPDWVEGSWWRKDGHRLEIEDLSAVWDEAPDVLIIGTGYHGNMVVSDATREHATARGIELLAARTPEAVELFNRLQANQDKRVLAALHLTC